MFQITYDPLTNGLHHNSTSLTHHYHLLIHHHHYYPLHPYQHRLTIPVTLTLSPLPRTRTHIYTSKFPSPYTLPSSSPSPSPSPSLIFHAFCFTVWVSLFLCVYLSLFLCLFVCLYISEFWRTSCMFIFIFIVFFSSFCLSVFLYSRVPLLIFSPSITSSLTAITMLNTAPHERRLPFGLFNGTQAGEEWSHIAEALFLSTPDILYDGWR